MCRNIKTLFNFAPPATDDEVRAASIQFVRKLSGYTRPPKANEKAFARATEDIFKIARKLIDSLETEAPPKNREVEAAKAKARAAVRYGTALLAPTGATSGRLVLLPGGRTGSPAAGRSRGRPGSRAPRGLDALADDEHADLVAEPAQRRDRALLERADVDVAHERHVDLHDLGHQLGEAGEARVAGADVVDGEAEAEGAQAGEPLGQLGRRSRATRAR